MDSFPIRSRLRHGIIDMSRCTRFVTIFSCFAFSAPVDDSCFGESFIRDVESSILSRTPVIPFDNTMSMHFYQRGLRLCLERSEEHFSFLLHRSPLVAGEVMFRSVAAIERLHGLEAAVALYCSSTVALENFPDTLSRLRLHYEDSAMELFGDVYRLVGACPAFPALEIVEEASEFSNRPFGCSLLDSSVGEVMTHLWLMRAPFRLQGQRYTLVPLYLDCLTKLRWYSEEELESIVRETVVCASPCVAILPEFLFQAAPAHVIVISPTVTSSVFRRDRHIFVPNSRSVWRRQGGQLASEIFDLVLSVL